MNHLHTKNHFGKNNGNSEEDNVRVKSLKPTSGYVHSHKNKHLTHQTTFNPNKPSLSFVNYGDPTFEHDLFSDSKISKRNRNQPHSEQVHIHSKRKPNVDARGPTIRPYGVPFQSLNNVAMNPAVYSTISPLKNEGINENSVYDHRTSGNRRRSKPSRAPKISEISYLERLRTIDTPGPTIGPDKYYKKGISNVRNGFATFQHHNNGYQVNSN